MRVIIDTTSSGGGLMRMVLIHGPISRKDLGQRLGLSPASLTRLSRPLLEAGLLTESAHSEGIVGRPMKSLDVRAEALAYGGVKLTADRVFAVCTDLRARVLGSAEFELTSHQPSRVFTTVRRALECASSGRELEGVGVTIGGQISGTRVLHSLFMGWKDLDLSPMFARLGKAFVLENDVTALTAAQHWFGVAKGMRDFALLTVGSGVGYGLVIHDELVVTPDNGLGSHLPLFEDGPICLLGHRGCSSALLSTGGLLDMHEELSVGHRVTEEQFRAELQRPDSAASQVMRRSAAALGRLAAAISSLTLVDTVIVSGESARLYAANRAETQKALDAGRTEGSRPVRLVFHEDGFEEWAQSAAAMAIRSSFGTS